MRAVRLSAATAAAAALFAVTGCTESEGEGIRQKARVTGGTETQADRAVAGYRTYVQAQADETLTRVKVFTDAVAAGDVEAAKKAYANSRIGWERAEPVAGSFGDIDLKVDGPGKGPQDGRQWTGWHRLEKALWQDRKLGAEEKALAPVLYKDLVDWRNRVGKAEITPASMADGAKKLLDEVATERATGAEGSYSHTDLVDLKANVEGAQMSYRLLEPVASKNDAALTALLDKRFTALNTLLDTYRENTNSYAFTSYDKVGKADREKLSDAVGALAEPMSGLAAAVTK